jgi:hypothetical protein
MICVEVESLGRMPLLPVVICQEVHSYRFVLFSLMLNYPNDALFHDDAEGDGCFAIVSI